MKWLLVFAFATLSFGGNGELFFNGNCITCHGVNHKNKSAPTIQEVQKAYKTAFSKKDDFIAFMVKWVKNPDEKTSIMQSAIIKYSLMPELGFDEYTLKQIAAFLYEKDFNTNIK